MSHTVDYENHKDLPFQGLEDCRAVVISDNVFFVCAKYTKFIEFTTTKKTSPRLSLTKRKGNGEKNDDSSPPKKGIIDVQEARERVFDVQAEEIETARMALLAVDKNHMRFTHGVQFDVRFVDKDDAPLSNPALYKILQKNWMLVPAESPHWLTFIVSSFPHALATCKVSTATCTIRTFPRGVADSTKPISNPILQQWHGGSMLLRTQHGLLAIVHSRMYVSTVAMYYHALALYANDFPHHLLSVSDPFRLPRSTDSEAENFDIQFASGIEYNEKSDKLFISYGHADCSAELAVLQEPFDSLQWHKVPKNGLFRMPHVSQDGSKASLVSQGGMNSLATGPVAVAKTNPGLKSRHLVRIAGPVTSTFSLGQVNREFALAVASSEYDLALRHARWGETADVLYKSSRFGHLHRFLERHLKDAALPAAVTVYNNWPVQLFPPLQGRWVWNLAWEFQAIPLSWKEAMMTQDVTIWTPSTFTIDALTQAGIPVRKVKYVPHAVDADDICSLPEAPSSIWQEESVVDVALKLCSEYGADFIYLYHGAALWRKGLDVLLRAYSSKQDGLEKTCLIVHMSYGDDEVYKLVQEHMDAHAIDGQTLIVLSDTLKKEELAKLFRMADAIVHPSRAEGFGLVAAQALACNKTLIATAEGATRDFANSETSFLVRGRFVECNKAPCSNIGIFDMEVTSKPAWYEPGVDSLLDAMVSARYDEVARSKKQAAGYKLISEQFSRRILHQKVKTELDDLLAHRVLEKKPIYVKKL